MELSEFIIKWQGKKCDYDKAFGPQCVDLARQWMNEGMGIKQHTGSVDGAKDLYLNYNKLPLEQKYLRRIAKCKNIKPGDLVIWDKSDSNKYGHVAIAITKLDDYILVLEQNGITQDGVKIILRDYKNYLGVLRKK